MTLLLSLPTLSNRIAFISATSTLLSVSVGSPLFPTAYRLAFATKAMNQEKESSSKAEAEQKPPAELPPPPPPPPPEKPLPGDCCGNGCEPCVWDIYYGELEDYNKLLAESKSKGKSS